MFCNGKICFERVSGRMSARALAASMSMGFHVHPVECHAIHNSRTIEGLVTNVYYDFAG